MNTQYKEFELNQDEAPLHLELPRTRPAPQSDMTDGEDEREEQRELTPEESQIKALEFSLGREDIIQGMQAYIDDARYQDALELAAPYKDETDSEFRFLMATADKYARRQKNEKNLLDALQQLSPSERVKRNAIYKRLSQVNPENAEYREQCERYEREFGLQGANTPIDSPTDSLQTTYWIAFGVLGLAGLGMAADLAFGRAAMTMLLALQFLPPLRKAVYIKTGKVIPLWLTICITVLYLFILGLFSY